MKSYPSIKNSKNFPKEECVAFVKYDGSNMRAEWSHKKGWHKFGTRNFLVKEDNPVFQPAVELFLNKYGDDLEKVFRSNKFHKRNIVVFGEFFGNKSFAGAHVLDDVHDFVVFDVNVHKKGFLLPQEFLEEFGHLNIAEVVYKGELNEEFIEGIRESHVDFQSKYIVKNEIPEGVICKGGTSVHKFWMCKIKSNAYKQELKKRFETDWMKRWE